MNRPRSTPRLFFIPDVPPEKQEEVYATFAAGCGCLVTKVNERVYSIDFVHDGVEWTATVGESLQGIQRVTRRRKGKKVVDTLQKYDPAIVLAIFDGPPCFKVVTNHRPDEGIRSFWANPFLAGKPTAIVHFAN